MKKQKIWRKTGLEWQPGNRIQDWRSLIADDGNGGLWRRSLIGRRSLTVFLLFCGAAAAIDGKVMVSGQRQYCCLRSGNRSPNISSGISETPTTAAARKTDCHNGGGCGLSSWSSSAMGPAAPDMSGCVAVGRLETSVRRPVTSWWRMLMNLEIAGARQSLGNCALAFFPFFQFFFPECIAESAVEIRCFPVGGRRYKKRILIGSFRQNLAAGENRTENENQKNCSCQISHSFILLDNSSNNNNAIYFEKKKCQGRKK